MDPTIAGPGPSRRPSHLPRNFLLIGLMAVAGFLIYQAVARGPSGRSRAGDSIETSTGSDRVVRIAVEGMSCEGCAESVAKELRRVDGVSGVRVHYDRKTAEVTFAHTPVHSEALLAAVHEAGYEARIQP
jgi:copper chaperone CopZ